MFFWCSDWESECESVLLEMVVSQWVKICGFSYASGSIEKLKETQKRILQKLKGVRRQCDHTCDHMAHIINTRQL